MQVVGGARVAGVIDLLIAGILCGVTWNLMLRH